MKCLDLESVSVKGEPQVLQFCLIAQPLILQQLFQLCPSHLHTHTHTHTLESSYAVSLRYIIILTNHDKSLVCQTHFSLYFLRLFHQNLPLTRLLQGLVPAGSQCCPPVTAHTHTHNTCTNTHTHTRTHTTRHKHTHTHTHTHTTRAQTHTHTVKPCLKKQAHFLITCCWASTFSSVCAYYKRISETVRESVRAYVCVCMGMCYSSLPVFFGACLASALLMRGFLPFSMLLSQDPVAVCGFLATTGRVSMRMRLTRGQGSLVIQRSTRYIFEAMARVALLLWLVFASLLADTAFSLNNGLALTPPSKLASFVGGSRDLSCTHTHTHTHTHSGVAVVGEIPLQHRLHQ